MLWNLPFLWLAMAVAAVVILSFIVATALDALIRDEAFGAIGNTVVMTFGFLRRFIWPTAWATGCLTWDAHCLSVLAVPLPHSVF